MIEIFRRVGDASKVVCTVSEDGASIKQAIMGIDEVVINVTVDSVIDVTVGDYIMVDGIAYELNRDPEFTQKSELEHEYSFTFEHPLYRLLDKIYIYKITKKATFTLTGRLSDFVSLLAWNMNKTEDNPEGVDTGWSVGNIVVTDYKTLVFSNMSCRDVLTKLASDFGVEFFLKNKLINYISHIENETGLVFEQGKGKGLYSISQKNVDTENAVTRVYPIGGTQNVTAKYADVDGHLILPEIYIENFSEYQKVVEKGVEFSNIYPSFIGAITSVSGENNSVVKCTDIDFNIKEVAVGDEARINFLSGDLMGKSFSFQWHNETKEITLIEQEDDTALADETGKKPIIPSPLKLAKFGDEFNFTGLYLPESYNVNAIAKLRKAATDWLDYYCRKRVKFELRIDYRYLRGMHFIMPGDLVKIKIPEHNIDRIIRVTSIDKKWRTGELTCIVSNYLDEKWEKKIEGVINDLKSTVANGGTGGGGSSLEIIESTDNTTEPSDKNLYSALKAKQENDKRLRKDICDELPLGVDFGDFVPGAFGSGGCFRVDPKTGKTYAEVHKLLVKDEATFNVLNIHELKSVGGTIVVSCADMKCTDVTEAANYYRCYFDNDEGHLFNQFDIDDQARCQTFDGKNLKYYWRLVIGKGDNYIDLSKTDKDGSSIPAADDKIIQFGNRTNPERQHLTLITAYGSEAPALIHYSGINSYTLSGREITSIGKNSKFTGRVIFEFGSSGWKNIEGLEDAINKAYTEARIYAEELIDGIGVGGVNLLLNSGFTGNYKPLDLKGSLRFSKKTDLFSDHLGNWIYTDAVDINPDESSRSGYSCSLNGGRIEQNISNGLLVDEIYCVSFIAQGGSVAVGLGGVRGTLALGNDYKRYVFKIQIKDKSNFFISGNANVAELKVERGTIATDWTKAYADADTAELRYQALDYVTTAIANGSSEALGGLFLTNMIMLGNYSDKKMTEVTAGISGTSTSGDDPAFWSGGTFLDALKAISDPYREDAAKSVITHGGKAIFNDAIIRGYIEALDGIFRGTVYASGGEFCGRVLTNIGGNRIVLEPGGEDLLDETKIVLLDPDDNILCEMGFVKGNNDELWPAISVNEYDNKELVAYSRIRASNIDIARKGENGLFYSLSMEKSLNSDYMTISGLFPNEEKAFKNELYRTQDGTIKVKL